jgi:hypothetical protein
MVITDGDLVVKIAVNLQPAAWACDRFWLDGIRGASDRLSFEHSGQRFGHNVRAVSLDGMRDLRIGDKLDLNRVVDLIAGLFARVLNAAHEVPRQTFLNQRRRQRRV